MCPVSYCLLLASSPNSSLRLNLWMSTQLIKSIPSWSNHMSILLSSRYQDFNTWDTLREIKNPYNILPQICWASTFSVITRVHTSSFLFSPLLFLLSSKTFSKVHYGKVNWKCPLLYVFYCWNLSMLANRSEGRGQYLKVVPRDIKSQMLSIALILSFNTSYQTYDVFRLNCL